MKKIIWFAALLAACNGPAGRERPLQPADEKAAFRLQLVPASGSVFHYDIVNESQTSMEVSGNTVENSSRTTVGVIYEISKDSSGHYVLQTRYDKILLHTRNGDKETDADAANAAVSADPVERMLGILKDARLTATLNASGTLLSMQGYQELTDQVMAKLAVPDLGTRTMAQERWKQLIEEGVIRKNIDQLFRIFPDSTVRVGDSWAISTKQKSELNLWVHTTYTLQSIADGVATVASTAQLASDSTTSKVMNFEISGKLSGKQTGIYKLDIASGMLLNSRVKADMEGSLFIMGREVPVSIRSDVNIHGKKIR